VLVTVRSDLGQVGHCQHLPVLSQALQQPADRFRHRTADAGIDFIEDQRRNRG
jgi:hypothetical protein